MFVRLQPTPMLQTFALVAAATLVFAVAAEAENENPVLTDQTITDKIEDELSYDPGVISTKIDVSTSNGIVSLTGNVNNILAKERSARVSETVKGVRAVVNRIKVRPVKRSDSDIQTDVQTALVIDPSTESYEIAASVHNGEVTLTGTVDSYQERDLAATVVKGVRGVTQINDQLEIDFKTDRPDKEIEQEIEQALRWNTHVDNYLINVNVQEGMVALSGTVGSASEKRLAESDAWVAGVSAVDSSKLSVEKWARDKKLRGDKYVIKSQNELQDAIQDALLHDPRVMSFDVNVEIAGSLVTLRGDVDSLKAKRAAEQTVKNTAGVTSVMNRIKVRPTSPLTDVSTADAVRGALQRDPYVERFEITVSVIDGTAHLYGTVDSFFERNRADDIASRILGVFDVKNHLLVDYDTYFSYDPYVDETYVGKANLAKYERRAPLKTDAELQNAIESEMWWSPFVNANKVTVSVEDGIATLTGKVDSWSESQSAAENAYEGGATLVDNDLTIDFD